MAIRPMHDLMIEAVAAEQRRLASRRRVLAGSAKLAGGGALALAAAGMPSARGFRSVLAQEEVDVGAPVAVLNYALTLEHLEATFYRDGLDGYDADVFEEGVFDNLGLIRDHEVAHVDTLIAVITDLGGEPVEEAEYDFGDAFDDPEAFLATAQALENTGVAAYTGAAQFLIDNDELLTAALTIHGVEARHAAYLNRLNGASPFPDAVDGPLTPDQVMAIATPFIVAPVPAGVGGTSGTSGASGAGVTTAPATGTGSAYRSSGAGDLPLQLGLLGLAAVGAAALLSRRSKASVNERAEP